MGVRFQANTAPWAASMISEMQARVAPITAAMADALYRIVDGNFGDFGMERPFEWTDLTPAYAKEVKRNHATLVVSGALRSGVIREYGTDKSRVYMNNDSVPYAMAQMKGYPPRNLPARSVWPLDSSGEALPFTAASVTNAAQEKLESLL